jgi:transcriptional regulator with XRE-family HTH domain
MRRRRLPLAQRLPTRLKLGDSIREARRAVGLTQESLGQRLGLKGRAIYRWERNETAPTGRHRPALIREIHLLNAQAGLKLQTALTTLTGKSYTVVSDPVIEGLAKQSPELGGPAILVTGSPQQREVIDPKQGISGQLELAILKMADELDVSPRQVRRALSRFLERLPGANITLESIRVEVEHLLNTVA